MAKSKKKLNRRSKANKYRQHKPKVKPEPQKTLGLDHIWEIGSTVAGKTLKWVIDWHVPYVEFWIKEGNFILDAEATEYLSSKKKKNELEKNK